MTTADMLSEHTERQDMWPVLADRDVDAYLTRIGADQLDHPNSQALRRLQERHVLSVPFETIAFYTGEPVPHTLNAVRKIVTQRRGGCCLELNSAFGTLLSTLGYLVELLPGRIYRNSVLDKGIGHAALKVTIPSPAPNDTCWLVDVGQGNNSRQPLQVDLREAQPDPHGTYLLASAPHGDLDVSVDGKPLYRMETRPRDVEYWNGPLWWYRTSPRSPFAAAPISIARTERGRKTLRGNVLITESDGQRVRQRFDSDAALLNAYLEHFGIALDRVPSAQERVFTAIAAENDTTSG
jgi:N-hydroxyarylamine O-acetyltransferase